MVLRLSTLILLILLLDQALPVYGQTSTSVTLEPVAVVASNFSVEALRDLEFGFILNGSATSIDARSDGSGHFRILSTPNGDGLTITLTSSVMRNDDDETETIEFALNPVIRTTNERNIPDDRALNEDGMTTISSNAEGILNLFIGGTVSAASDQAPGRYSGKVNILVEELSL